MEAAILSPPQGLTEPSIRTSAHSDSGLVNNDNPWLGTNLPRQTPFSPIFVPGTVSRLHHVGRR